jgi:hypothetical protein
MLGLLLTFLLGAQQSQVRQEIDISWVFVNDKLMWESPPKELKKTYVLAENAELIVFYPTGDIAMVSCTLFRDRKTRRLSICHGCGFSISKGTWTRNADNSVTIKSRVVYRNLPIIGSPVPDPEIEERWRFHGRFKDRVAAVVHPPTGRYIPLSNLSNLDFLSNIILSEGGEQK